MTHELTRLERNGFARASTTVALRSVSTCPMQCFRPASRPLIGVATFTTVPDGERGYRFEAQSASLRDDALPGTLADWLEQRWPETGAIVCWEPDRGLIIKLSAIVDPARHPRLARFVAAPGERFVELPKGMLPLRSRAWTPGVPCLCRLPGSCEPELPACFLPDPAKTETQLVAEAERAWRAWASIFGNFDDPHHPAQAALRAHAAHAARAAVTIVLAPSC